MSFNSEPENQNKWHNDPNNWIWGIFYYNPEDSRLFPPKKIKQLGWTINFANPNSVFLVIVLIAIVFIFS
ncbi:hypothetical protein SAMN05444397_107205 [Flavobacterium aquidurense]|uniref:DUF5808 domain-containing protein n=1 Tax=Flavobacterium frigidimaris TaxID=262320 RepID=A0ABX4BX30_FLAFR|nr:DUF5808 domain-containing protein [Flavobacterium frigidimaris]OXA82483.1 hypothetical protein B0A65_00330 [Flavobacterium frigidimaris]SDZ48160.1 hypothetical protein SAMN05444397_107205 [Flavobacterium aquidurense]